MAKSANSIKICQNVTKVTNVTKNTKSAISPLLSQSAPKCHFYENWQNRPILMTK
jgi:hypothetical protein